MSNKYLKYKKKYLELKKTGGQFDIDRLPQNAKSMSYYIDISQSDDYYLAFESDNPNLFIQNSNYYESSNNTLNHTRTLRNNLTLNVRDQLNNIHLNMNNLEPISSFEVNTERFLIVKKKQDPR